MASAKRWLPLGQDDSQSHASVHDINYRRVGSRLLLYRILAVFTTLSLFVGSYWSLGYRYPESSPRCLSGTKYANLERNTPVKWTHDSDFNSHNRSVLDDAWKTLDENLGIVALDDDWVAEKELPAAQRWPWDDSKGLYILQSHHSLHCLHILRNSLLEFYDERRQSRDMHHVMHCLDSFRQDIVCNADDTPRYTGFSLDHTSGLGQARQCRDWSKLESWAKERSACYRYDANADNSDGVELSQFKHCPDGSRPYEQWRYRKDTMIRAFDDRNT